MGKQSPSAATFAAYHAHVYFDAVTKAAAMSLCENTAARFDVTLGNIHERPVGPHPCWSRQIAFAGELYSELMAWFDQQRDGLTLFVHGLSGDALADHTIHVEWLGPAAELNLDMFRSDDK